MIPARQQKKICLFSATDQRASVLYVEEASVKFEKLQDSQRKENNF